jgi:hypothetical protein
VVVWAADRVARGVRHFLEVLNRLDHPGIELVSFREELDCGAPLGRAVMVIVSALAELERNLINATIERVRAGLRRVRLEGRVPGRKPIEIDHPALLCQRVEPSSSGQGLQNFTDQCSQGVEVIRSRSKLSLLLICFSQHQEIAHSRTPSIMIDNLFAEIVAAIQPTEPVVRISVGAGVLARRRTGQLPCERGERVSAFFSPPLFPRSSEVRNIC